MEKKKQTMIWVIGPLVGVLVGLIVIVILLFSVLANPDEEPIEAIETEIVDLEREATQAATETHTEPTEEASPEPTALATAQPTEEASPEPTALATDLPTEEASPEPTALATAQPTEEASPEPTETPTEAPAVTEITISEETVISNYPDGMTFSATILAPTEITRVALVAVQPDTTRAEFAVTGEADRYSTTLYTAGELVPWQSLTYFWVVEDSAGNTAESLPTKVTYSDETGEWTTLETPQAMVYVQGEVDAATYEGLVDALTAADFRTAFGGALFDMPLVVIFMPADAPEAANLLFLDGYTNATARAVIVEVTGREVEPIRAECFLNEERDTAWQTRATTSAVLNGIAGLYQTEFYRDAELPAWWLAGTAALFRQDMGYVNDRLSIYSIARDLPILTLDGPSAGIDEVAEDGCTALGRDLGYAFAAWLLENYGGLETHAQIVSALSNQASFEDALRVATGKSLIELQNEWRATLDLSALPTP